MTPWETVQQHAVFPERLGPNLFVPEPLQIESINELAVLFESGHWLDMGTGKTFISTACAMYHRITHGRVCLVVMPPLLIMQWGRWLAQLKWADGRPVTYTEHRGTPAKRNKLDLNVDFVLTGIQIFKRDIEKLKAHFYSLEYVVILDEATFAGNISSAMHQMTFDFCSGRPVMLLSGTPANNPIDAYALIKFTAPGAYQSRKQFENIHVDKRDLYDKPTAWRQLDTLSKNLLINSKRILYQDMYQDIETPLYDHTIYELGADHMKLYRKLADEEIIKLEDGGKIDATNANKLRHALGQIVVNFGHFSGDPANRGSAIEMVEEKMANLGSGKLVIFAHYRMTVRSLITALAEYNAVAVNSEVNENQRDRNVQRFINDPLCRVIVIQYISGGKGLDGMQHVCHTALCIEPCQQPRDFHQAVARLHRRGQKKRVHVLLPTARRTLQVRGFKALIENDTLVNKVVRNGVDLRKEIFGDEG